MGRDAQRNGAIASIESVYQEISEILETARSTVYRAVNTAMVKAYWEIGRVIVEEEQKGEQRAGYGNELIEGLSRRLSEQHGRGFSRNNLW